MHAPDKVHVLDPFRYSSLRLEYYYSFPCLLPNVKCLQLHVHPYSLDHQGEVFGLLSNSFEINSVDNTTSTKISIIPRERAG